MNSSTVFMYVKEVVTNEGRTLKVAAPIQAVAMSSVS